MSNKYMNGFFKWWYEDDKKLEGMIAKISKQPEFIELLNQFGRKPDDIKDIRALLIAAGVGRVADKVIQNHKLLERYLQLEKEGKTPPEIAMIFLS